MWLPVALGSAEASCALRSQLRFDWRLRGIPVGLTTIPRVTGEYLRPTAERPPVSVSSPSPPPSHCNPISREIPDACTLTKFPTKLRAMLQPSAGHKERSWAGVFRCLRQHAALGGADASCVPMGFEVNWSVACPNRGEPRRGGVNGRAPLFGWGAGLSWSVLTFLAIRDPRGGRCFVRPRGSVAVAWELRGT